MADPGEAPKEASSSGGATSSARHGLASWASKLGQKASELKSVTQTAMQQTKEAVIGEAKIVAKDMVDLKDGVAEGMRLTVQDSHLLRERLQQQTRKVFHREEMKGEKRRVVHSSSAGATSTSSTEKRPEAEGTPGEKHTEEAPKGFFRPDAWAAKRSSNPVDGRGGRQFPVLWEANEGADEATALRTARKGDVLPPWQDLKAGGKKAAEKVRDVGGKLWHKTDHWLQSLRGHEAGEGKTTKGHRDHSCFETARLAGRIRESEMAQKLGGVSPKSAATLQRCRCSCLGLGRAQDAWRWRMNPAWTGLLEAYAQSAVLFYDPADPSAPAAEPSSSSGYSVSDAPAVGASYSLLVTSDGSGDPCGLRECSALPLLCSPSINPHLSQVPVEALKINEPKKWKPSAPVEADLLGTSGAVPVPPQADLLEVQAVPAVNPVDTDFWATWRRRELQDLGILLAYAPTERGVVIHDVDLRDAQSSLACWNRANPQRPIRVGQVILEAAQAETSDLLGNLTTDNLPSTIGSAPPVSVPNGGGGSVPQVASISDELDWPSSRIRGPMSRVMKLFGCLRSPLFGSTGGFRVSLDRVGDEPIGMVATYCPSAPQSQGLVIRDVTADEGSAILRWNQRHPKRQLLLCEHLTPLQSEILSSSRRRSKAIAAVEAVIQEIEVDTEVTEQCAICYEDLTMQAPRLLRIPKPSPMQTSMSFGTP
eukprot:g30542.t3